MALTLKIAIQSFRTLWLMMLHHNTKFGYKMFGGIDIIWTHIGILTRRYAEILLFFFFCSHCLTMMYYQTKFGYQGINSSEDIVKSVILSSYEPSL